MKILLISTLYYPNLVGGAERVVQKLAEALVDRGHEVMVACLENGTTRRQDVVKGVRVYYMPVRNLYWPFGGRKAHAAARGLWHALDTYNSFMAKEISELIEDEQPDVVNTHNIAGFSVSVWSSASRHKVPIVHTMHDQYLLCPNTTMFKAGQNCNSSCRSCSAFSWPRKKHTSLVDVVTGVSQFILNRHANAGFFVNVPQKVVYNASPAVAKQCLAAPLQHSNSPLRFGFLGRLDVTKGIELLIQAFLRTEAGTAELLIGGKGNAEYEESLKKMTSDRSDITWLGHVDPASLLNNVDLLIVPSLWNDTAPLVVQEAAAYGLPVLGSNRGGIPELIAGGTGWIFEPTDPIALATTLKQCIVRRSELSLMRTRALESSNRFSVSLMVEGYLEAYKQAMAKNIWAGNRA